MTKQIDQLAADLRAVYFGATALTARIRFQELPGSEQDRWRAVAAASLAPQLAEAWAEGFQAAADETLTGFAPDGPTDELNPYVEKSS